MGIEKMKGRSRCSVGCVEKAEGCVALGLGGKALMLEAMIASGGNEESRTSMERFSAGRVSEKDLKDMLLESL